MPKLGPTYTRMFAFGASPATISMSRADSPDPGLEFGDAPATPTAVIDGVGAGV